MKNIKHLIAKSPPLRSFNKPWDSYHSNYFSISGIAKRKN